MKTETDKLNDRINELAKIIDQLFELDKIAHNRIDITNKRIDLIKKAIS